MKTRNNNQRRNLFNDQKFVKKSNQTPTTIAGMTEAFQILLSNLYAKCHTVTGSNLNFKSEIKKANIHDQRVSDFLRDMNVLSKQGKKRASIWFWVADCLPNPKMCGYLAKNWFIWKSYEAIYGSGNYSMSGLNPYPINPKFNHLFKTEEVVTETTEAPEKKVKQESQSSKELKMLAETIKSTTDRRRDRWETLTKQLKHIENQNTVLKMLLGKPRYMEIPILFGLFKIRRKITLKYN